jgi:hypothetical protein
MKFFVALLAKLLVSLLVIVSGAEWKGRDLIATKSGIMVMFVSHGEKVTKGQKLCSIEWADPVDESLWSKTSWAESKWIEREQTLESGHGGYVRLSKGDLFYSEAKSRILTISRKPLQTRQTSLSSSG